MNSQTITASPSQPTTEAVSNRCKIYLLDNFDSFTYNLVDEFKQLGFEVVIYRNNVAADYILAQMAKEQQPILVVLSPGPGDPKGAGCLLEFIQLCKGKYPIFGICLGHQAIVESYGGSIGLAPETVHGKLSTVIHNGHPIFANIPEHMNVARYHSLQASIVPDNLTVIAHYQQMPMAVVAEEHKVLGFQFHPESILTTRGSQLIKQSLAYLSGELE